MQVGRYPVRRQNCQPFAVGVDKCHHGPLVRRLRIRLSGVRAAFVAVVQRGFVAVMPVGDHQLVIFHGCLDGRHSLRFRNHPQPVHDAALIAHFGGRSRGLFGFLKNRLDAPLRIRIQHKKLAGMRFGVSQKFQAVGLRPGKGVLVPEDNSRGIVFQLAGADESPAGAALFRAGHGIFLDVGIKSRGGILDHDVIANPVLNGPARARVNIVLWRVARVPPAFLHDDQVVWVSSVVLFLHRRRYLVVRLGQHAVKRGTVWVVAKSAEGVNLGHGVSRIVFYCF